MWRRFAALALAGWLALTGTAWSAERSVVTDATIKATRQGYALDANVNVALNPTLEDALTKGIDLHFLLELEVTRPRDWWFDEDIVDTSRKLHLYYHLLLRRYVVESGYMTKTTATLSEALARLGHVDDWQVLERGALKIGRRYDARLRLRLDTSRLPKPLSIGAVTGDRWDLSTPWYAWSFDAPSPPPAPSPLP